MLVDAARCLVYLCPERGSPCMVCLLGSSVSRISYWGETRGRGWRTWCRFDTGCLPSDAGNESNPSVDKQILLFLSSSCSPWVTNRERDCVEDWIDSLAAVFSRIFIFFFLSLLPGGVGVAILWGLWSAGPLLSLCFSCCTLELFSWASGQGGRGDPGSFLSSPAAC